ncbi:hypothetical protein ACP4OV_019579 [Aristida adscensionis]
MSQATPPPPPPVQADAAYNVAYLGASGVRFAPEDWELIAGYLRRKIHGEPLPAAVVHDGDVYSVHPKKLVSEMGRSFDGSWYVFSPRRRKYPHGSRPSRLTDDGTGHWKSMSAKEAVHGADGKVVIGYKCGLTFHEHVGGDGSVEESKKEGKKTTTEREHGGGGGNVEESKKKGKKKTTTTTVWKMQELVVAGSDRHPDNAAPDKPMQLNEWVLCKITNKSLLETEEGAAPVVQGPEAEQLQQRATSSGGDESPDDQHLQASAEAPNGPDVAAAAAATILQEPWPDDDGFFYDGASFLDENYADLAWWEELLAGGDYMGMADGGGESSGSQDKHPLEQQQQQREEEATASGVVAGSQDEQQQAASGGVSGKQDHHHQQQQQQQAAPQALNGGYVNVAAAASPETGLVLGDHDWKRHLGVLIP